MSRESFRSVYSCTVPTNFVTDCICQEFKLFVGRADRCSTVVGHK